jgi:hypothetical protein
MPIIFDVTVVATFDNTAGGSYQRLFDFSNGAENNNILFGNPGTSSGITFETYTSTGTSFKLLIPNAIDDGVETTWRATIDDDGVYTVYKNGVQIGTQNFGTAGVPEDVARTNNLIGESPWGQDAPLIGEIKSVDVQTTLNNGFDLTNPNALDGVSTYSGTDNDETLNASANTGGITLDGRGGNDTLTGGTGNDTLTGGTGNDTFIVTPNQGNDVITDFNTGNTGSLTDGDNTNNDSVDLSAFYDNLSELYADFNDDGILNQSNATDTKGRTVDYTDNTSLGTSSLTFTGGAGNASFFTVENTNVACFTPGTMIKTNQGERAVENLRKGDLVETKDNGLKPVLWIGQREVSPHELNKEPKLRPIRIASGSLAPDFPKEDLIVSPQHRVLVKSSIIGKMYDESEVLVAAKDLLSLEGVEVLESAESTTYLHILFDRHEVIYANGAEVESLFTGPEAMKTLSKEAREEIYALFPEIVDYGRPLFDPARLLVKGKKFQNALQRHTKNNKAIFAAGL